MFDDYAHAQQPASEPSAASRERSPLIPSKALHFLSLSPSKPSSPPRRLLPLPPLCLPPSLNTIRMTPLLAQSRRVISLHSRLARLSFLDHGGVFGDFADSDFGGADGFVEEGGLVRGGLRGGDGVGVAVGRVEGGVGGGGAGLAGCEVSGGRSVLVSGSRGSRACSLYMTLSESSSSAEASSDSSLLMPNGVMLSSLVLMVLVVLVLMLERRVMRASVVVLDERQAIVLACDAGAVASSHAVERVETALL